MKEIKPNNPTNSGTNNIQFKFIGGCLMRTLSAIIFMHALVTFEHILFDAMMILILQMQINSNATNSIFQSYYFQHLSSSNTYDFNWKTWMRKSVQNEVIAYTKMNQVHMRFDKRWYPICKLQCHAIAGNESSVYNRAEKSLSFDSLFRLQVNKMKMWVGFCFFHFSIIRSLDMSNETCVRSGTDDYKNVEGASNIFAGIKGDSLNHVTRCYEDVELEEYRPIAHSRVVNRRLESEK